MILRIFSFTLSLAMASPSTRLMLELKKYLSSKMPCGVCDVLVGRDARDRRLVHPDVVGDVAQVQRLQVS